jgi:predicted PurR-regulated permease PerM
MPPAAIPSLTVRQVLLLVLIGALLVALLLNLYEFIPAFLGAYTLYVLWYRPLTYLTMHRKWHPYLVALTLLVLTTVCIIFPLKMLLDVLQQRVIPMFQHPQQLLEVASRIIHEQEARFGVVLLTPDTLADLTDWSVQIAGNVVDATLNSLITVVSMYIFLWFMLIGGLSMEHAFFDSLPLRKENIAFLRIKLHALVLSNALGIPLMGIVQGIAGFVIYYLLDVPDVWLWTVITFVTGMIPLFGTLLAYVPLSLLLLSTGNSVNAFLVVAYGFLVIGSVDNLARMWVLKRIGNTHPLITFFGVIAGLKMFGFVGFVFGPISIAVLFLLMGLYQKEFSSPVTLSEEA